MATANTTQTNEAITKQERATLAKGLDMLIASNGRKAASEPNPAIKQIREQENEQLVILKNKLMTKGLFE